MNIINLLILLTLIVSLYLLIYYKSKDHKQSKNTQPSSSALVKSSLNPNEYYPTLVDNTNSAQSLVTDPLDLNYNISTGTLYAKNISANFNGTSASALNLEKNGTGNLLVQTNPTTTSLLPQGNAGQVLVSQLNNIPTWINAPASSGLSYTFPNAAFFGIGSLDEIFAPPTISAGPAQDRMLVNKNFTVENGTSYSPIGNKMFISGTLTINGVIVHNASNANGPNGGRSAKCYSGDTRDISGTTAISSYRTSRPPNARSSSNTFNNSANEFFSGGDGGYSIGGESLNGLGGSALILQDPQPFTRPLLLKSLIHTDNTPINAGAPGGCGQTVVFNNITYLGGGGGGGGGVIYICANRIVIGSTGRIEARGGNGGNGQIDSTGTIRGGGGGGGGGGLIFIVTREITGNLNFNVSGGIGGNQSLQGNMVGKNGKNGRVIIVKL